MLRLENVSKFYSSNGLVATGFSKVNLNFEIGEFVAITGESGSGKSTLLNVISGLDSYEEGEMYIIGQPTSGFARQDLEDYRKKYIGNIFQSFNLINSYTVYQNVELILLMSGYEKENIAPKVKEIISKVGLSDYEKTKTSKLSGGQKQRVAIARALAKETPIIVADEPTGNLDSQSATEIIKLLHELSRDKLIIIVTHNYEQVEPYVTRKISMHDGNISEDKTFDTQKLKAVETQAKPAKSDALSFGNMTRLSVRNTFNIPAKFILLLIVFLFLCAGVIAEYSSFLNAGESSRGMGGSQYFADTSKERIIVTREDKKEFKKSDYDKLKEMANVNEVVENDLILDSPVSITKDDGDGLYISAKLVSADKYKDRLASGRLPEKKNEIFVLVNKDDEYTVQAVEKNLNKKVGLNNNQNGNNLVDYKMKVVGYGYVTEAEAEELHSGSFYLEGMIGVNESGMKAVRASSLATYCSQVYTFANTNIKANTSLGVYPLKTSSAVPSGELYIPEEIGGLSQNSPVGQEIKLKNKSLYFEDNYTFKVGAMYTEYTLNYYLGLKNFEEVTGSIFINPADYNRIFNKGNYQSSVMVEDIKKIDETVEQLEAAGYDTFRVNDAVASGAESYMIIINTFRTVVLAVVLIVLFFITYFISKLILKSRNSYYAIVRMIGGTKQNCSSLLRTELFCVFNIAYFICIIFAVLVNKGIINSAYLLQVISFLEVKDYIILYVVLCFMSLLLAGRYSRQLFKKTAMNAHKEEV